MTDILSRRGANSKKFEDIESQATMMKLINKGQSIKSRKISAPKAVVGNKEYTFGIKSNQIQAGRLSSLLATPHQRPLESRESAMKGIMMHTDNLKESLQRKISLQLQMDELRHQ